MDPASVVGIAGSLAGLADLTIRSIKTLKGLHDSYKAADYNVVVLIQQLTTLKAALVQIHQWVHSTLAFQSEHTQLASDIQTSAESCSVIVLALNNCIVSLAPGDSEPLGRKGKVLYVWEEQKIKDFNFLLGHQTNALQLLLTAVQCRTVFEQKEILQAERSREIFKRAEDDSSSLLQLASDSDSSNIRGYSAGASARTRLGSDFDARILESRVYRNAAKTALLRSSRRDHNEPANDEDRAQSIEANRDDSSGSDLISFSSTTLPLNPANIQPSYERLMSDLPALPDAPKASEGAVVTDPKPESISPGLLLTHETPGHMLSESKTNNESKPMILHDHNDLRSSAGQSSDFLGMNWDTSSISNDFLTPTKSPEQGWITLETSMEQNSLRYDTASILSTSTGASTIRRISQETLRPINEKAHVQGNQSSSEVKPLGTATPTEPRSPKNKYFKMFSDRMRRRQSTSLPEAPGPSNDNLTADTGPPLGLYTKVLLLGTGLSGKTTVMKSLRRYCEGTFDMTEREMATEAIIGNIVNNMRAVLDAMESLGIPLSDPENEYHVQTIYSQSPDGSSDPEVCDAIQALWQDAGVRAAMRQGREYSLADSAAYFFDNVERIMVADQHSLYMPTDEDILRARVRTTGIHRTSLNLGGCEFTFVDTGGERSERKKWIHCFDHVGAVIFVADISNYDMLLTEDETVNRMQEQLTLFDSICNSRWFAYSHIVLLFTKVDALGEKLKHSPMENYFPDYEGGCDLEQAKEYIAGRFVSLNQNETKPVHIRMYDFVQGSDPALLIVDAIRGLFSTSFTVRTSEKYG